MSREPRELPGGIDRVHHPQVESRGGHRRDDRPALALDGAGAQAGHVERREVVALLEPRSRHLGPREAERAHLLLLDRRDVGDRLLLLRVQRHHVVVETGDRDAALIVLHRGEQPRELEGRVGRPVAVVAAVEIAPGAEHGQLRRQDATGAEEERRPAAQVPRTVHHDHEIAVHVGRVRLQRLLEHGRPRLLVAFEDEPERWRRWAGPRRWRRSSAASRAAMGPLSSEPSARTGASRDSTGPSAGSAHHLPAPVEGAVAEDRCERAGVAPLGVHAAGRRSGSRTSSSAGFTPGAAARAARQSPPASARVSMICIRIRAARRPPAGSPRCAGCRPGRWRRWGARRATTSSRTAARSASGDSGGTRPAGGCGCAPGRPANSTSRANAIHIFIPRPQQRQGLINRLPPSRLPPASSSRLVA